MSNTVLIDESFLQNPPLAARLVQVLGAGDERLSFS